MSLDLGFAKGDPKTLLDGETTDKFELLLKGWSTKEGSVEVAVPAAALPLEEPQKEKTLGNPFLCP